MADISLRGITKTYGGTVALEDVSLDVADGELLVLLGPSGCGKSTLLRVITEKLGEGVHSLPRCDLRGPRPGAHHG